jgi:polyisoprenoid-binding protein YceI
MKPFRLILFAALCLCATAHAGDTFKIDPAHSTIAFKVRHMLGTAKGNFLKFSGTINVDRDHPEQSSVTVTIETQASTPASQSAMTTCAASFSTSRNIRRSPSRAAG